jgi:general secretion pathway protein I
MRSRRRSSGVWPAFEQGFTLLEVLVALAILAIAFAASIRSVSQAALTLEALQDRMEANALLSERLDEWRFAKDWPALGDKRQGFSANQRDWVWFRQVSVTPDPDMRKVVLQVGLDRPDQTDGRDLSFLVSRIAYLRRMDVANSISSK